MGYTKDAIYGFSWQTILKVFSSLVTVAKIFFLARILAPSDFGLFSLTAIALGLTESVTQTGVNITIIQSKHSINYYLNSAWVIAITRGFLIGIAMVLLGMGMSQYFKEPQLLILIGLASLVPIIKGFINPAIISYQKNLEFFKDSLYRFSLIFVEAIFAVLLAYWLKSVMALVLSVLISSIFEVTISFIFFKLKPRFHYIESRGKEIIHNAKWLSPATLLSYLSDNIDDFLIGKTAGTYSLGLYHNAYALSHKANYDLSKSVQHGTLPIFSKIAHDTQRLKKAFKKSFSVTIIMSVLASIPLLLFPKFFVLFLLGNQWTSAVELIRPLTIAGIIQSMNLAAYILFMTKKDYITMNIHLLVSLILMAVLIITLGNAYGLIGAVSGITFSRIITFPIIGWGIKKNLNNS